MERQIDRNILPPCVVQAVPGERFRVYAYCNDGAVRLVDVEPLIRPGTVFSPLADPEVFRSRLTVMNDTIAWDLAGGRDAFRCVDIAPETVFEAPVVRDPLAE